MTSTGHKKADRKVVILGDSGVGKTSLIRRYIDHVFIMGAPETIGASFFVKHWKGLNIALWDTAGGEKFEGIRSFYSRNAHAVILCYDICERSTLDALVDKHSVLFHHVAPNCVLVFVGTKSDLVDKVHEDELCKREVSVSEVEEIYAKFKTQLNCLDHPDGDLPVFETSSKDDENVTEVFEYIFDTLVPSPVESVTSRPIGVLEMNEEKKENKCCNV